MSNQVSLQATKTDLGDRQDTIRVREHYHFTRKIGSNEKAALIRTLAGLLEALEQFALMLKTQWSLENWISEKETLTAIQSARWQGNRPAWGVRHQALQGGQ